MRKTIRVGPSWCHAASPEDASFLETSDENTNYAPDITRRVVDMALLNWPLVKNVKRAHRKDTLFDSGISLEEIAVQHGHYPEDRSENKGSEPEAI